MCSASLALTTPSSPTKSSQECGGHLRLDVTDKYWHDVIRAAMALRTDRQARLPEGPDALIADAVHLARSLIGDAHRIGDD